MTKYDEIMRGYCTYIWDDVLMRLHNIFHSPVFNFVYF